MCRASPNHPDVLATAVFLSLCSVLLLRGPRLLTQMSTMDVVSCLDGFLCARVQMGQEVQVRISDINTDNNTVNLSMVPAGAYDDRSGGGYGESSLTTALSARPCVAVMALSASRVTCFERSATSPKEIIPCCLGERCAGATAGVICEVLTP